jgi:electron transfer flavoprotein alpha subunit
MTTRNNIRINPKREQKSSTTGLKRVVLQAVKLDESVPLDKPLRTTAKAISYFLVVAHSDRGALDQHARQTIAAAAILADTKTSVIAMILGELNEDLAEIGADEVMILPSLNFQQFQPDIEINAILKVMETIQPRHIFMPDNLIGDGDLGRRLIAHTQLSAATQVVEIDKEHIATYQLSSGQLVNQGLPEIILLAPNAVDSELPFKGTAKTMQAPELNQAGDMYLDKGLQVMQTGDIALEEADFIVSAGNGVRNLSTLKTLADALGASIGASRVVVDDGKLPRDKQIGATGKTVTASTYIAIGISGAVQHLQGIKGCRHVIAINYDSTAPIVKRADLSIIGDAEDIMQALITEITSTKTSTKTSAKKATQ